MLPDFIESALDPLIFKQLEDAPIDRMMRAVCTLEARQREEFTTRVRALCIKYRHDLLYGFLYAHEREYLAGVPCVACRVNAPCAVCGRALPIDPFLDKPYSFRCTRKHMCLGCHIQRSKPLT